MAAPRGSQIIGEASKQGGSIWSFSNTGLQKQTGADVEPGNGKFGATAIPVILALILYAGFHEASVELMIRG